MPKPKGAGAKAELVRLALAGIDAKIQELEEKRAELSRMIPRAASTAASAARPGRKRAAVTAGKPAPAKKKRVVSAATRRKLKEAAKARWARIHGEQ